jgi:hypothetical protein
MLTAVHSKNHEEVMLMLEDRNELLYKLKKEKEDNIIIQTCAALVIVTLLSILVMVLNLW